ncbi:MAG: hypothetical protein NTY90_01850 [Candidatus Micrarchaeota archaeon]|nr:hypothetical protein [Candidatus Micrarchaeota archaeon]
MHEDVANEALRKTRAGARGPEEHTARAVGEAAAAVAEKLGAPLEKAALLKKAYERGTSFHWGLMNAESPEKVAAVAKQIQVYLRWVDVLSKKRTIAPDRETSAMIDKLDYLADKAMRKEQLSENEDLLFRTLSSTMASTPIALQISNIFGDAKGPVFQKYMNKITSLVFKKAKGIWSAH